MHGWTIVRRAKYGLADDDPLGDGTYDRVGLCGSCLIFTGHWDAAVFAFILPAAIASGMLAFVFDWLVHHPHDKHVTDRYRTSNVYLFPKALHWPVTMLWIFQNYHIIHHLYPRVPFYRYPRVFDRIRPLLEMRGTCITVFRWAPGLVPSLSYAPAQAAATADAPAPTQQRKRDAA